MQDSFMKYALSTILGRALPDLRDGLKPVHRRILPPPASFPRAGGRRAFERRMPRVLRRGVLGGRPSRSR